jgi:ATP phosphoribosyltransferase regulatory subunit
MLPSGFYDNLTPDAAREAALQEALLGHFAAWGYARVAPPLMEFEDSLLSGPGAVLNHSTFRVMDAVSHRMLGLRTDHTLQIGRLAATRLANAPRPLRLSYGGQVLRTMASERDPARQKTQIGIELIGSLSPKADAESIVLGVEALHKINLTDISVDLVLPTLVPALLDEAGLTGEARAKIHHALDRKDEADVTRLCTTAALAGTLQKLLRHSGEAVRASQALHDIQLPEKAAADRARLDAVLELLKPHAQNITVDLVESRCFEYQTGVSFSFFSKSGQVELGRGGRYRTATDEPATGLTFYADALMQVLPPHQEKPIKAVPFTISADDAAALHAQGFVLVRGLG